MSGGKHRFHPAMLITSRYQEGFFQEHKNHVKKFRFILRCFALNVQGQGTVLWQGSGSPCLHQSR
jgi:hypothetical protein